MGEAETYLGEKWEDDRGGCTRQLWLAEKVDARWYVGVEKGN